MSGVQCVAIRGAFYAWRKGLSNGNLVFHEFFFCRVPARAYRLFSRVWTVFPFRPAPAAQPTLAARREKAYHTAVSTVQLFFRRAFSTGCLLAGLATARGWGAELVFARDGSGVYGYKDTPKLPWCEWQVHDPDRPVPPRVDPGPAQPRAPAPSEAVVLFAGGDLSAWRTNQWRVENGEIVAGPGNLVSQAAFGDCQIHLEWLAPAGFDGPWYDRGNNGVLLMGLYEIQIFDSYHEKIYPDGQAAAIYGQTPPRVNVTRPPASGKATTSSSWRPGSKAAGCWCRRA